MAVTHYSKACQYHVPGLKNEIHLVNGEDLEIFVDVDVIRAKYIGSTGLSFKTGSISVDESQEAGDRYQFEHTVEFTVPGHVPFSALTGLYYAVVVTEDNTPYIVNPLFPAKVTFTYTLSEGVSQTTFQMGTVSNHPLMKLVNFQPGVEQCVDFSYPRIDHLLLNEKNYTSGYSENIIFTNSGFKMVKPGNKSISVTETFDGTNARQEITFSIPMDSDGTSWPFHLLEFKENRYCAVLVTNTGDWVLAGFGNGLEPTYTITADGDNISDITVTLSNTWNSDNLLIYVEGGLMIPITEVKFEPIGKGAECVNWNKAIVNLKAEQDMLGNGTGRYMARTGKKAEMEVLFPDIEIIDDTFDEIMYFKTTMCYGFECFENFNPPSIIVFQQPESRFYAMASNVDWWITCPDNWITISPASGSAGVEYNVEVTNTLTPGNTPSSTTLTMHACGEERTYRILVSKGEECFTDGTYYTISPEGQTVVLPSQCCIDSYNVVSGSISNYTEVYGSYISFYVPANDSPTTKTVVIDFTFCNGNVVRVTVDQLGMYTEWRTLYSICQNFKLCDVQAMFSGTSPTTINTQTDLTRVWNCREWSGCTPSMVRWVASTDVMCYNSSAYYVEYEEGSLDNGTTWIRTGVQRIGSAAPEHDSDCEGTETYTDWRPDGTKCDGLDLYVWERQWISNDNINFTPTDVYRYGNVVETGSTECGTVPSHNYEKWMFVDETECDGYILWQMERLYISDDGSSWTPTDVYRRGIEIDTDSSQCGFPQEWEERWVLCDDPDAWQCGADIAEYAFYVYGSYSYNIALSGAASGSSHTVRIVSTVNGEDIGWVPTNVPGWIHAEKSGDTLVVDILANYGTKRNATFQLVQNNSHAVITVNVSQLPYTSSDYVFTFQSGQTVYFINEAQSTSGETTLQVISTEDGSPVEFIADNHEESWLSGSVTSTGVTVSYSANGGYTERTNAIKLIQKNSGYELMVYVTQAPSPNPYVFEFYDNHSDTITINVPSGGTDYGTFVAVQSTNYGQPDTVYVTPVSTAADYTQVRIDGQGSSIVRLAFKVSENKTQSQRTGVVEVMQQSSGKIIKAIIVQAAGTAPYVFQWSNGSPSYTIYKETGNISTLSFTNTYNGSTNPTVTLTHKEDWMNTPSILDSGQFVFTLATNTGETRTGYFALEQDGSGNVIRCNVVQYSNSGYSFYFDDYQTEISDVVASVGGSFIKDVVSTYSGDTDEFIYQYPMSDASWVSCSVDNGKLYVSIAPNDIPSSRGVSIGLIQSSTSKIITYHIIQFGSPAEGVAFNFEGGGTQKTLNLTSDGTTGTTIGIISTFAGLNTPFDVEVPASASTWMTATVQGQSLLVTVEANFTHNPRNARLVLRQPKTSCGIILNIVQEAGR